MIPHLIKSIDYLPYYVKNEYERTSFSEYYLQKIEIKDFYVLDDVPIKNKEQTYAAYIEMNKNNDY